MRSNTRESSFCDAIATKLSTLHLQAATITLDEFKASLEKLTSLCKDERDSIVSYLKSILQNDPKSVVVGETAFLDTLGLVLPLEVRDALIDYMACMKESNGIAQEIMWRLGHLPLSKNVDKLALMIDMSAEAMKIFMLLHLPSIVDTSRTSRDVLRLIEKYWNEISFPTKASILGTLHHFVIEDSLAVQWRDRACQCFAQCKSLEEIFFVLSFCLHYCSNEEIAGVIVEHFRIHVSLLDWARSIQAAESDVAYVKRAKSTVLEYPKMDLNDLVSLIKKNKFGFEAFKKWAFQSSTSSSLSFLFCILFSQFPNEEKSILGALERINDSQQGSLQEAVVFLLRNDPSQSSKVIRLANLCAKQGALPAAGILFTSVIQNAEVFVAWGLLSEFTGYITDPNSSSWALQILSRFVADCPHLVARNRSALLIVMDHLEYLSKDGIRDYFKCLLRIAVFCCEQQSDSSLWNDLQIIFRKQVSSLDPKVCMYGALSILAMLSVLLSKQDSVEMADEPTCSQGPLHQSSKTARYSEQFFAIFDLALSGQNCSVKSVIFLMTEMVSIIPKVEDCILKRLSKTISLLFEENFIYEQRKIPPTSTCKPLHNVDDEDALIGICFFEKSSIAMGLRAPHIFKLLQATEKLLHYGALDNIDALLGCPILLPEGNQINVLPYRLTLINWLRVLVNAFHDQDDKEVHRKCILRLQLLSQIPANLDESEVAQLLDGAHYAVDALQIAGKEDEKSPAFELIDDAELWSFLTFAEAVKSVSIEAKHQNIASSCDRHEYLIPWEVNVFIKYLGDVKHSSFLLQDLMSTADTVMASWSVSDVSRLALVLCDVTWSLTTMHVILRMARLLAQKQSAELLKVSLKIAALRGNAELAGEEITLILDIALLSKSVLGWESICDQSIEYCFSNSSSAVEAETILEKILSLHQWDLDLTDLLHGRFIATSYPVERKKLAIHQVFCKALANFPIDSLEAIRKMIPILDVRVQLARNGVDEGYAEGALRFGRIFIERFTKLGLPMMQTCLASQRNKILETMKQLQTCTRSLQIICNHLKPRREAKYRNLLPPMRKALEALLFGVKQMLQANNCLTAFWMGNLKHRAIDGAETSSQIPLEASSSDSSTEPEDPRHGSNSILSKEIVSDSDEVSSLESGTE